MAKHYLIPVNYNQNELLFPVFQNLVADPNTPAPKAGQLYFNTGSSKLRQFNGTVWEDVNANTTLIAANVSIADAGALYVASNVEDALQEVRIAVNALVTNQSTQLSIGTITATTFGITSDGSANDVILPEANTTQAGLLGAGKWNEIVANTLKLSANTANVALAGAVMASEYNAFTVLVANADNTPIPLTIGANTVLGRIAGNIQAITIDSDLSTVSAAHDSLASALAIKTYVDGAIATADAFVIKGGIDCSTNPNYPAADAGHAYRVTVAGKIGGAAGINVEIGDLLICFVDASASNTHALIGANWIVEQTNLEAASTTVAGFVRLSTTAETIAGTLATIAVTPASLFALTPVDTRLGLIELATQAEVNTGTDAIRAVTPATLQSKLGLSGTLTNLRKYTTTLTGALTAYTITHNLGSRFIIAQVFRTLTPFDVIECEIENTTINSTTFKFTTAPTTDEYTVVIAG